MNIDELKKKLNQFCVSAELKLEEATKAISEDNFELANTLQGEADVLMEKANAVKSQLEKLGDVGDLKVDEPAVTPEPVVDPVRPPFEPADPEPVKAVKEEEVELDKAVHILRYGEEEAAMKAVTRDLYGNDYAQKREQQMNVFVKALRFGEGKLSSAESTLLNTVIYLPDAVRREIKSGRSVGEMKATLQEMLNDLGGFTVPEDFRTEIISRLMGLTVFRQRARVVTTNRDAVEWPKLEGGNAQYTSAVRVTWVDEVPSDATVAATNPTFGMLRVPVHTVMARTDISRNLLEDSAFNLLDVVADLFAEAMAMDEDNQFATGRGGGVPRGVLSNGTVTEPSPETGVAAVASGNATALLADGIKDLYYNLHSQYRGNAVFVGARTTHRDIRKLKDGESRYLWEDSIQRGEPPNLLGAPFLETESVPTVGANKYPLIFGDLRGYLIADRVGMSIERVTDVSTVGTNTVALFGRRRLGGQVIEPWRLQAQKVATTV